MTSTVRRKLVLSRETLRNVSAPPQAGFATVPSDGSWCAACQSQYCTGGTSI